MDRASFHRSRVQPRAARYGSAIRVSLADLDTGLDETLLVGELRCGQTGDCPPAPRTLPVLAQAPRGGILVGLGDERRFSARKPASRAARRACGRAPVPARPWRRTPAPRPSSRRRCRGPRLARRARAAGQCRRGPQGEYPGGSAGEEPSPALRRFRVPGLRVWVFLKAESEKPAGSGVSAGLLVFEEFLEGEDDLFRLGLADRAENPPRGLADSSGPFVPVSGASTPPSLSCGCGSGAGTGSRSRGDQSELIRSCGPQRFKAHWGGSRGSSQPISIRWARASVTARRLIPKTSAIQLPLVRPSTR